MIRMVIQKIKNKKWLNICLLIGIILMTAMFSCHPLLEKGACTKIIKKAFVDSEQKSNKYPMTMSTKEAIATNNYKSIEEEFDRIEKKNDVLTDSGVSIIANQILIYYQNVYSKTEYQNRSTSINIGCMNSFDEKTYILKGKSYDGFDGEDIIPCLISEKTMDDTGLVVGERLYVEDGNFNNNPVFIVAGVCKEKSVDDYYWDSTLAEMDKIIFVTSDAMDRLSKCYKGETVACSTSTLFNFLEVGSHNVYRVKRTVDSLDKKMTDINFEDILSDYSNQRNTVKLILLAIEIPCIIILLLFIYMIISQLVNLEEGEIAMIKSRGVSTWRILEMYILHGGIICIVGCTIGVILGYWLCKISALTDRFLEFSNKDTSEYTFQPEMIVFGLLSGVIVVVMMTVLAYGKRNATIVTLKNKQEVKIKTPVWEKYCLDLLLLATSTYLLFNYKRQSSVIAEDIANRKGIDPLLFLNLSLFIFACSLLFLRLQKYFIILIDKVGKKHWNVSAYISFIQLKRTFNKQFFLSVFLIMTLACGVFNSNLARTINENGEERIKYDVGCDVVIQEKFGMHIYNEDEKEKYRYDDIDCDKYYDMESKGLIEEYTKVIVDNGISVNNSIGNVYDCKLMGINTKEFGETAVLKDNTNEKHWFHYLNRLANNDKGVIISKEIASKLNVNIGDTITINRFSEISKEDEIIGYEDVEVVSIIECFPGCNTKLFAIANHATLVNTFGMTPYEIWIRLNQKTNIGELKKYLEENHIVVDSVNSIEERIAENRDRALFQITNGIFSVSFFVSLLVSSIGFLLYWIMSIKERGYFFGVLRAMGMKMKEVYVILIIEQIFSSVLSLAAGFAVGFIATGLFTKLLAIIYLPTKHNIPVTIAVEGKDTLRLLLLVGIITVICFCIIKNIIKKLEISKAIKL